MRLQTYEDVVRRDQPLHWWRTTNTRTQILPNSGRSTGSLAMASSGGFRGGARGLPGSPTGGGVKLVGNLNTVNGDGWVMTPTAAFPTSDFLTLEIWMWPFQGLNNWAYSLFWRTNYQANIIEGLTVSTAQKLQYRVSTGNVVTSSESVRVRTWNHCVAVVGYAAGSTTEVWLNGKRISGVLPFGGLNVWSSLYGLQVGRAGNTLNSLPAFLAEPAVYGHRLTGQQITDHYEVGLGVRRRSAALGAFGFPFVGDAPEPPPPPPPGGLTPISEGLPNRRVLLVSDRPR